MHKRAHFSLLCSLCLHGLILLMAWINLPFLWQDDALPDDTLVVAILPVEEQRNIPVSDLPPLPVETPETPMAEVTPATPEMTPPDTPPVPNEPAETPPETPDEPDQSAEDAAAALIQLEDALAKAEAKAQKEAEAEAKREEAAKAKAALEAKKKAEHAAREKAKKEAENARKKAEEAKQKKALDDDFAKMMQQSVSSPPEHTDNKPTPSIQQSDSEYYSDQAMTMEEKDRVAQHITSCWTRIPGMDLRENMQVALQFNLHLNGALASEITIMDASRYASDPHFRALADSAVRAIHACSPIRGLPPKKYAHWRELEFVFNPSGLNVR